MIRIKDRKNDNTFKHWDSIYNESDPSEFMKERYKFYEAVTRFIKNENKSFLDIGCGMGEGLMYLKDRFPLMSFTGYDFSTRAIQRAIELHSHYVDFYCHNIYHHIPHKKFDYIAFIETLEHIEDPFKYIDKYLDYCDTMIISTPYQRNGWSCKLHINFEFELEDYSKYHIIKHELLFDNNYIILAIRKK